MSKAARGSCNPQSKAKGHGVVELWLATPAANGRKDASAPNCPGLFWPGSHPRTTLDTVPPVSEAEGVGAGAIVQAFAPASAGAPHCGNSRSWSSGAIWWNNLLSKHRLLLKQLVVGTLAAGHGHPIPCAMALQINGLLQLVLFHPYKWSEMGPYTLEN